MTIHNRTQPANQAAHIYNLILSAKKISSIVEHLTLANSTIGLHKHIPYDLLLKSMLIAQPGGHVAPMTEVELDALLNKQYANVEVRVTWTKSSWQHDRLNALLVEALQEMFGETTAVSFEQRKIPNFAKLTDAQRTSLSWILGLDNCVLVVDEKIREIIHKAVYACEEQAIVVSELLLKEIQKHVYARGLSWRAIAEAFSKAKTEGLIPVYVFFTEEVSGCHNASVIKVLSQIKGMKAIAYNGCLYEAVPVDPAETKIVAVDSIQHWCVTKEYTDIEEVVTICEWEGSHYWSPVDFKASDTQVDLYPISSTEPRLAALLTAKLGETGAAEFETEAILPAVDESKPLPIYQAPPALQFDGKQTFGVLYLSNQSWYNSANLPAILYLAEAELYVQPSGTSKCFKWSKLKNTWRIYTMDDKARLLLDSYS